MIFGEKFRRKYALSEAGEANVKKGTFWTVVTNHKNRESGGTPCTVAEGVSPVLVAASLAASWVSP